MPGWSANGNANIDERHTRWALLKPGLSRSKECERRQFLLVYKVSLCLLLFACHLNFRSSYFSGKLTHLPLSPQSLLPVGPTRCKSRQGFRLLPNALQPPHPRGYPRWLLSVEKLQNFSQSEIAKYVAGERRMWSVLCTSPVRLSTQSFLFTQQLINLVIYLCVYSLFIHIGLFIYIFIYLCIQICIFLFFIYVNFLFMYWFIHSFHQIISVPFRVFYGVIIVTSVFPCTTWEYWACFMLYAQPTLSGYTSQCGFFFIMKSSVYPNKELKNWSDVI